MPKSRPENCPHRQFYSDVKRHDRVPHLKCDDCGVRIKDESPGRPMGHVEMVRLANAKIAADLACKHSSWRESRSVSGHIVRKCQYCQVDLLRITPDSFVIYGPQGNCDHAKWEEIATIGIHVPDYCCRGCSIIIDSGQMAHWIKLNEPNPPCHHNDWTTNVVADIYGRTKAGEVYECSGCGLRTDRTGYTEIARTRDLPWYEKEDLPL